MSFHASCNRSNSCHRCKTCSYSSDDTCIHANYAVCNETNTRRMFKTIMLFNAQCALCKLSNSCCLSCNLSHAHCQSKSCTMQLRKFMPSEERMHRAPKKYRFCPFKSCIMLATQLLPSKEILHSAIEVNRTAFLRNYVVRFKPRGEFCNQMLHAVVNHVILERSESRHLSKAFSEQAKNGWL